MRTLDEIEAFIQEQISDRSTKTQTQIRRLIQMGIRKIRAYTPWHFDEAVTNLLTVAGQEDYMLPVNFRMLKKVIVTIGTTDYPLTVIHSREQWDELTRGYDAYTSDIPLHCGLFRNRIHIYPTPASSGNTIELSYFSGTKDYTSNDFTDKNTGTVAVTNGDETVTFSGGTVDAQDKNRHIRIDNDGYWYKIATYTDSTHVELDQEFDGVTGSGLSFLLGTLPPWGDRHPEGNEILYNFVMMHLYVRREEFTATAGRAAQFREAYNDGIKEWRREMKNLVDDSVLAYIEHGRDLNPNDFPINLSA